MAPKYERHLPSAANLSGYREPALGGGSIFWRIYSSVRPAVLSDANEELISLYQVVRDDPAALIAALTIHEARFKAAMAAGIDVYDRAYYELRALVFVELDPVARAARTIVLNRLGLNGLFRTNASGGFNVPVGRQYTTSGEPRAPTVLYADRIHACSRALQGVTLRVSDMVAELEDAGPGELVYLDPPYLPTSDTANFVAYTARGFTEADHARLARAATAAAKRGVLVALSNSDTPTARALYKGHRVVAMRAMRSISSKVKGRGTVGEILVLTW